MCSSIIVAYSNWEVVMCFTKIRKKIVVDGIILLIKYTYIKNI